VTTEPTKPELLLDGELDRATDVEYAAISGVAVVGLVLGLVGAIAVLAAPLLAVPAVGALISLAALRKIRRSEGVLTGRRVALAGIAVGILMTAGVGLYHFQNWYNQRQMLGMVKEQAYDVIDELLAGQYTTVLARMPEDFRNRQAAGGPEELKANVAPLLKDGGTMVNRQLLSLMPVRSKQGDLMAPAQMRVDLERRILNFKLWFKRTAANSWELVGIDGAETIESQIKYGTPGVPPQLESPIHEEHSHDHDHE
jgi:hypothetical protein